MNYTPENITELQPNEVFVFGSNANGNHAGGAARVAVEKFGAIMGQAEGLQGQSYAIPTLDKNMQKVDLDTLQQSLLQFCWFAQENTDKTFYLTKIGLGIAGFTLDEMLSVINRVDIPSNVVIPKEFDVIYGYKGFEKDLTCRGYQYEVGKDYEEKSASCCDTGFHFCRNPFDVLSFYSPTDDNGNERRYCKVTGDGDKDINSDKVACTKLHIEAEVGLKGLIEAGVKFIFDRVKWSNKESNTGNRSAATNTGDYSAATNTGNYSAATNTGNRSAATNTGDYSAATNTGNYSAATNTGNRSAATNTGYQSAATNTGNRSAATNTGNRSAATNTGDRSAATNTGYQSAATNTGNRSAATNTGYQSAATNTGDYSAATNTGYQSAATNTGDYSAATNTGNYSAATVKGKESVAIVIGKDSKARGAKGSWIVLTERGGWNGVIYPIKEVKAFNVDGEQIKENVFYKLINGEPVEVE